MYAHNTAPNTATGLVPFTLVFGREPVEPIAAPFTRIECKEAHTYIKQIQKGWEFANELRERINDTKDNRVPAKRNFKLKSFKVGDRVRVYMPIASSVSGKLNTLTPGPYTVLERRGEHTWLVSAEGRSGDKPHEAHEDNMFQWNDPAEGPLLPSTTTDYLPSINNKDYEDTLVEPSGFMVANWSHILQWWTIMHV